jgi:Domain of unknown function (DUF4159)
MPRRRNKAGTGRALAVVVLLIVPVGYAFGQFGFGFRDLDVRMRRPTPERADRAFSFCRLLYTSVRSEPSGRGWSTDYPLAEINMLTRLSELTKTHVPFNQAKQPPHWVVRLTDDELFECPFMMASDVGTIGLQQGEADQLRTYLLKGGFLWVDDFWGTLAWEQWEREIAKALPPSEFPIEEVPMTDPIFKTQFNVSTVPQITNIGFWRSTRGRSTSERGSDSKDVHFRVIRDSHHRIMVVMTHNTDVADSWEREGEDPGFFYQFSPAGYALGINVLLHAMTH